MKTKYFFLILIIFISVKTNLAIVNDSIVNLNQLNFRSELEKKYFIDFISNSNPNYFSFFIVSGKNDILKDDIIEYRQFFDNKIEKYENSRFMKKRNKRKVKKLFREIHNDFLQKYDKKACFSDVFIAGRYNCVSASILYALIFKELDIPFQLKRTSNHVFLIAYPNEENIKIETTNPNDGFAFYNNNFKKEYIEYLLDAKLISKNEYKNNTVEELFSQYFYKEENISLYELGGLQYYNKGFFQIENMEIEKAYNNMSKSYYLYPYTSTQYFLYFLNIAIVQQTGYSQINQLTYFYNLLKFDDILLPPDLILQEYINITELILNFEGKINLYDSTYNYISENIDNDSLMNDISFVYYYFTGIYYCKRDFSEKCFNNFSKAYLLKPNNADVEMSFAEILKSRIASVDDYSKKLDTINFYKKIYPKIVSRKDIIYKKYISLLFLIKENYEKYNIEKAEEYKKIFEKEFSEVKNDFSLGYYIQEAYSEASHYYYKKGNREKAKQMLKKGLEFAPENDELLRKLRHL